MDRRAGIDTRPTPSLLCVSLFPLRHQDVGTAERYLSLRRQARNDLNEPVGRLPGLHLQRREDRFPLFLRRQEYITAIAVSGHSLRRYCQTPHATITDIRRDISTGHPSRKTAGRACSAICSADIPQLTE